MAKHTTAESQPKPDMPLHETVGVAPDAPNSLHDAHEGFVMQAEFWVAVAFFVFIAAAFKPIRRALLSFLDKYAAGVREELAEARQLREEAERTLADIQKKQETALADAKSILEHAYEEAARLKERAVQELEQTLKRQEQQALEKISQAEADAIQDIRNRLVGTVILATEQLISQSMDEEADQAVFDQALSNISKKLH